MIKVSKVDRYHWKNIKKSFEIKINYQLKVQNAKFWYDINDVPYQKGQSPAKNKTFTMPHEKDKW